MTAKLHHPHFMACWLVLSMLSAPAPFWLVGCSHRSAETKADGEGASKEGEETATAAITSKTVAAKRRTITESVFGLGTCESPLDKSAVVAPAIEGQVSEILVKHGEKVEAGQPVLRLDAKLADANLREKISTRDGLKSSLKLLQALPRPEEQKSHRLAIDEAKVALQKAESAVARLRPLRERGDIPQQQMFEAELAVQQAQIALQKAESQYGVAMLGPRREAVEEAQAHIAIAEAGVAAAQRQLDLHTLRSPIAGVIDRIACKLGQTLTVGVPAAEIVEVSQIDVLAWFPAPDVARVHPGQAAEVRAGDAPRKNAESSTEKAIFGKVIFVGGVVDPQTGSLPVRVSIENRDSRFVLGQTVTVAIAVREKADALVVPAGALDDLGDGPRLNVVREGKSVILHPRIGLKCKDWVEVEGTDLQKGEPVIVEGGYNLPEGTKVSSGEAKSTEINHSAEWDAGAKP